MRIFGIDPGETTGWSLVTVMNREDFVRSSKEVRYGYAVDNYNSLIMTIDQQGIWKGMEGFGERFDYLLRLEAGASEGGKVDAIVAEDYIVYPSKAAEHSGSKVYTARELGRVEWMAHCLDCAFVEQPASQAVALWPNKRIRDHFPMLRFHVTITRSMLHDPYMSVHALSSFRHILAFVENNGIMKFVSMKEVV